MKKYVETKTISAEPMTRGMAAAHHLLKDDAAKMNPEDAGYHIVYGDGYHSWAPADVFEQSCKIAETPADRMEIEGAELHQKCLKLHDFMLSCKFQGLTVEMRAALMVQYFHMQAYNKILGKCLMAMEHADECGMSISDLTWGDAEILASAGFAIRRTGWNGTGQFVVKQIPQEIGENIIPKMNSISEQTKSLLLRGKDSCIRYRNQMLIIQPDGTADSWVPSPSDLFAEDWQLVI